MAQLWKSWDQHLPFPQLLQNEIHAWYFDYDQLNELITKTYEICLSPDERLRATQFRFKNHRQQYIATRGILRTLLGLYLDKAAPDIEFEYTEYGKPNLLQPESDSIPIQFNVSHSGRLALFGFTLNDAIGVDIEHKALSVSELDELAKTVFSPLEMESYQQQPHHKRKDFFYAGWTRKEAYIKAHGVGLSFDLSSFSVSLAPDNACLLVDASHNVANWSIIPLTIDRDYSAAMAIQNKAYKLHQWHFQLLSS